MPSETPPESGYLNLADLSEGLRINALQTLACPVIAIVPDGKQLGSGVLVKVDGVSGILTVQHVVFSEEFRQAKGLWTVPHFYTKGSLNEPTTHFSPTNIRTVLLRCFPETPSSGNDERGPDLAFIRIPKDTNFESSLRAIRINFYPLAWNPEARMQRALDENYSHLAIAGAPVKMSVDVAPTPDHVRAIIEFPVFLAAQFNCQKKENGHDFVDVPVDREFDLRLPNFLTELAAVRFGVS